MSDIAIKEFTKSQIGYIENSINLATKLLNDYDYDRPSGRGICSHIKLQWKVDTDLRDCISKSWMKQHIPSRTLESRNDPYYHVYPIGGVEEFDLRYKTKTLFANRKRLHYLIYVRNALIDLLNFLNHADKNVVNEFMGIVWLGMDVEEICNFYESNIIGFKK